jgi:hypothetical protein
MKILNGIACKLNWIWIALKPIQFNSDLINWIQIPKLNGIQIQLKWNEMQIDGESIENLLMNMVSISFIKDINLKYSKRHLSMPIS